MLMLDYLYLFLTIKKGIIELKRFLIQNLVLCFWAKKDIIPLFHNNRRVFENFWQLW